MVMGQLYTHEWYIIPIPQSSNQTPISSNNWSAILQGITNNLGAYTPNYVTMDYACQYVRATRTSRLLNSGYDPASGQVTVTLSGTADLDTSVYVFVGADNAISSSFGIVPVFSGSVTNTVARLGAQPRSLSIITQPPTLTYGLTAKGEFRLVIAGQPLQQYAIEVSDDLVNWAELTTVTLQDGTALLNAPAIASGQFYRARRLP
ncbi:MAG: hypothetical protein NT031_04980 [Planctomycetota bacterium]|nr:hypothetical protein [Planctomycetota bacterium]